MRLVWRQNDNNKGIVFAFKPGVEPHAGSKLLKPVPKKMRDICVRLLNLGGDFVVCYLDKESPFKILSPGVWESGKLITPKKIRRKRGESNLCVDNSMELCRSNPEKYAFAIGWGLNDECWRPHAWVMDVEGNVIETTEPREKYYGISFKL
jgi:hypothetical protein